MWRRIAAAAALVAAVFIAAPSRRAAGQEPASPAPQVRPAVTEIVLPPQLETEKPATLAVLDRDGRLAAGVTVKLPDRRRVTTDSTGRARFVVTPAPGPFAVEVADSAPGAGVQASSIVVGHPATSQAGSSIDVVVSNYSRVVALDDHIVVRGSGFRGDADINRATLGGRPALVLASSPVALVLQPGAGAVLGPADLVIDVAGSKSGPLAVTLVSLEITPPTGQLAEGKNGELIVHVNGTGQKVPLAVENLSAGAVELLKGNFQRVTSSGGAQNTAVIALRAIRAGDFSVSVRVMTAAPDASVLALVRGELVAASGVATGDWVLPVDRALARLDEPGADARGVLHLQQQIEKMLSANPPAELQKHLRAAWLELVRN